MIARASQLFLPTLRDAPADAEAVSHKLLVRGGFIRQVGAGLWTFLPLGWRVHRKVEQIIREEMDAIGGQEMLDAGADAGRAVGGDGPDKPRDLPRHGPRRPAVRPPDDARGDGHVPRARDPELQGAAAALVPLPDQAPRRAAAEGRPPAAPRVHHEGRVLVRPGRGGRSPKLRANREAYKKIFARFELETYDVQAESGAMGGKFSVDFLAPSGSGENTLVVCENGDYAADIEVARAIPREAVLPESLGAPQEIETPGVTTIEGLAEFLGIDATATSKAMPVVKDDGTVVLALIRGDDRLSETKLFDALAGQSRPATDDEIRAAFGASGGSLGPIGFNGEIVADDTLREGEYVAGANRDGWHLRGVAAERDFQPRFADLREPREGTGVRYAEASFGFRPRSRWATSSTSARSIRGRWRRRSSTRTARRSRFLAAATASGLPG